MTARPGSTGTRVIWVIFLVACVGLFGRDLWREAQRVRLVRAEWVPASATVLETAIGYDERQSHSQGSGSTNTYYSLLVHLRYRASGHLYEAWTSGGLKNPLRPMIQLQRLLYHPNSMIAVRLAPNDPSSVSIVGEFGLPSVFPLAYLLTVEAALLIAIAASVIRRRPATERNAADDETDYRDPRSALRSNTGSQRIR